MKLTETPEIVTWPESHYIFIEKIGPFQETAMKAWMELRPLMPVIGETNKITGRVSLYKVEPTMIYRAGVVVSEAPKKIPPGLLYEKFSGGKYSKFTLVGSYMDLPEASGRVFDTIKKKNISLQNNFFIENYVSDPHTTAEDQLITEILVPTK